MVVQVRPDPEDPVFPEVHSVAFHVQEVEVQDLVDLAVPVAFRGPGVECWGLVVLASAEAVVDLFLGHVREIDLQKKTRFLTWCF